MDLFMSNESLFDQQLVLLFILFYELGYQFGKRNIFSTQYIEVKQISEPVLAITYDPDFNSTAQPQIFKKDKYQHSLKLIKEDSNIPSEISQLPKTQPDKTTIDKPTIVKSQDELSRDFLSEKINVEGKKIQSRGIFHMTFQKAQNPKFIRKIQKHQIITDYEVPRTDSTDDQLIPLGSRKLFEFTDESSILEISTYENFKLHKFPVIEKKLIKTNQFAQFNENTEVNIPMSASLCENGKFNKFFKNSRKIGEGAFGVVYSVKNIFEGKEYAVKKLFIKSGLGKDKMETILNQSIKQVSIISQYSHPNIIRFYTCWLEIANLNQSISFNRIHFREHSQEDYSDFKSGTGPNFKKKKSAQECLEISYISSQANSGFTFQGGSNMMSTYQQESFGSPQSKNSDCRMISAFENDHNEDQQNQKPYSDFIPVFALYIQMQLCPEGSLDMYLHRRKFLNRSFAFIILDQLLHGVHYLHSNGLVHRDLKPGNILINKHQRLIKIGDFGLSARINENIQYGKIGTPSYIAPEIIEKRPLRKQELHLIDVYSIGVIYYELLNLFNLTTKHEKLGKINKLKQGRIQLNPDYKLERKLIKLMTKSKDRASIKQIFEKKQYLELSQMVQQDKDILDSWSNISGLEDYDYEYE